MDDYLEYDRSIYNVDALSMGAVLGREVYARPFPGYSHVRVCQYLRQAIPAWETEDACLLVNGMSPASRLYCWRASGRSIQESLWMGVWVNRLAPHRAAIVSMLTDKSSYCQRDMRHSRTLHNASSTSSETRRECKRGLGPRHGLLGCALSGHSQHPHSLWHYTGNVCPMGALYLLSSNSRLPFPRRLLLLGKVRAPATHTTSALEHERLHPSYDQFRPFLRLMAYVEPHPLLPSVLIKPTTVGAWQPYAVQLFLFIQKADPLTVALYFIPNALVGLLAVYVVQYTLHRFNSQWIFSFSMLANALAPALFLPIEPTTSYWALAMPGIALGTFGPDMSFVAASIFITSSVPKSYQGAAGSLLMTLENLSSAVFVAVAGAIGVAVAEGGSPKGDEGTGVVELKGLRAIWWFGLAVSVVAAIITAATVRINKAEEREHVAEVGNGKEEANQ